ncbi:CoA transferase [Marivibrio halodurans]|uniref:CoA transferase n=1 Tax=Marivibrio halodurans TaxID=2039722 RepID=A0A8J7V2P1_9PROT|nr:CaiB/BaiF CoA-transferase family protein [Marivibrio halodurans]MBP5855964.1 CoA transferase [Marivibrio halodurans]
MTEGADAARQPLSGIRVLDFTTLLPGPMATLLLAEAGAEVIKVERPGQGDELRVYPPPRWGGGGDTGAFALMNRGKRSVTLDLKDPMDRARLMPLIEGAQVLVEQFRPGAMARLGLDYDRVAAVNPALVYCSVTGWGQSGPMADRAGHDLNYIAETGLLDLGARADGVPVPPPGLIADIGGGALPAVINILLALREAERTGRGRHLDIAMADGVMTWQWWAQAAEQVTGRAPAPGGGLLAGGSPRYRVYRTADDRLLAVAPLEQRFWDIFCETIALPEELRDDSRDPEATAAAVARIIAETDAAEWERRFEGRDACVTVVRSVADARHHPHFIARGLFAASVTDGDAEMPALPVPIDPSFRRPPERRAYPRLGEANADLLPPAAND